MGKITTRYKSHLFTRRVVVRGQFMGVALLCLGEFSYMGRDKFKQIEKQFKMKWHKALTMTLRLCRFI